MRIGLGNNSLNPLGLTVVTSTSSPMADPALVQAALNNLPQSSYELTQPDPSLLSIPAVTGSGCVVGGIDPVTGDTIASCGGSPAPQNNTILYLGLAAIGVIALIAMVKR